MNLTSSTPFYKTGFRAIFCYICGYRDHPVHGSIHPFPDQNTLQISPLSPFPVHMRSQGFLDFWSWSDTLSFFTPGRSAAMITSSSCSLTSTRNSFRIAGSIRSVTHTGGSNLPPEDTSWNIFSGSALMFSISLHIESNGYLLHTIYIPLFRICPTFQQIG